MTDLSRSVAKILYVCGGRSFYARNLNRKLAEVAQSWRSLGYDVTQVCGGDVGAPQMTPIVQTAAVPYGAAAAEEIAHRLGRLAPPAVVTSFSEYRDIRHDRQMLQELYSLFRDNAPVIVWERSSRLHCAGLTFARAIGVPYVLEWKDHLVDYDVSLFRRRALALEAKKNREADYIVVESNMLRTALAREGVDVGKIVVAHNAVDAAEFTPNDCARQATRAKLGISSDTILVGYVGSYAFYHDALRLVMAGAIMAHTPVGRLVKVLMIGAGKDLELCRQKAAELGVLDSNVLMRPGVPQNEVADILSALDIAVLPGSTDIICPIKVQEYMAAALPCVVPDYAANREVIDDGRNGMLFTPKDASSLAQKIIELARDQSLRREIGSAARKDAEEIYSWAATWGAALETVLRRSRQSYAGFSVTA